MPTYDACLIDVFDTVLRLDGALHLAAVAEEVGVPAEAFAAAARPWGDRISDGRATLREAVGAALRECGVEADGPRLDALMDADVRIQRELVEVYADTVPFLEALRAAGIRTAFVSNCAEHTRDLLRDTGLADLVDELVLSFEVGAQKPAPAIYRAALERLEVEPARALLVDDRADYGDAARQLGLGALRIDRAEGDGDVTTLDEVTAYLTGVGSDLDV